MGKMTQQEALQQAQRRWGATSWIMEHFGLFMVSSGVMNEGAPFYGSYGEGDSWEAAFADADRKEQDNG